MTAATLKQIEAAAAIEKKESHIVCSSLVRSTDRVRLGGIRL